MDRKNRISAVHFGLIILSGQIGLSVISSPADLARSVGHDGWIVILLTGVPAIALTLITLLLLRRHSNLSIYEINRRLFGHWPGQVINWMLFAYLLVISAYSLRIFSEYIQLFHLVHIPPVIVTLLIMIPTLYLTWKGYRAIGRFSFFLLVVLGAIIFLTVKVSGDIRLSFLQPVASAGWPRIVETIPSVAMAFIGLELGAFIYEEVYNRNQALFWGMGATVVNLLVLEIVCLSTTGLFGEAMLKRLVAPLFGLSRYAQFSLLERMDLLFFILWFPLLETTFRAYFSIAYTGIRKLLHREDNLLYLSLFTCVVFGLSRIPADLNQTVWTGRTLSFLGFAVILYLVICWIFSVARREGDKA